MGQTVVEKIAEKHLVSEPMGRPLRAGDYVSVRPTHVMTHDNTAAVMKKFATIGVRKVHDRRQPVFIIDHDIQNRSEGNLAKYRAIQAFAEKHGIDFYPAGSGIGHQIICEQLYAAPGSLVVASDSHSNTYGAVGALGTPVVRTDAAAIWAAGEFWWQIPRTVQVWLDGELRPGVSGKDVILALCGHYNSGQVLNAAVEFAGPGVASLSMDARLTVSNMTTEWGSLTGWFPPDEIALTFLERRISALEGSPRGGTNDMARIKSEAIFPDDDAVYAARIKLDLRSVSECVAGPDSVQAMTPLAAIARDEIKVHRAYLVSCVNSRVEDLDAAARVLAGRKVAPHVSFYLAAASEAVQAEAEQNGSWQILVDAGAEVLPPGCGPCIGLGTGLLGPGETGISATNRNFKGRMGSTEARCYLASPAVVAASAAAGYIQGPVDRSPVALATAIETFDLPEHEAATVEILPGFPREMTGRLVFLPQDNLNTDGIYGKDYTYREDMTPAMMADVVMENYDRGFREVVKAGDILVAPSNFGTGSSREQAVTALQAKGIGLVIARTFSQTYLRNAFNNGFPCIECPDLVDHIEELLRETAAQGEKTVIPGDLLQIDFARGTVTLRGRSFAFAPLGAVPQALVVAGGVENQLRGRIAR